MSGPEMRFDDDVVVVTGAGRGLGREYALAFAARGAAVVVNDPSFGGDGASVARGVAESVAQEIVAAGGRAIANTNSVAGQAGAKAIVDAAVEAFGKVTVLVNNAGIIDFASIEHLSLESWRRMIDVTMTGAFHMTQAVWPIMRARRYGRIVNTTSNAGFAGNPQLIHYGAAKLGVAGFTRALAHEAVEFGIQVNAVAPMAITRMNRDVFFGGAEAQGEDWQADIRSGRVPMGPPSIVAPAVLWLAHSSTELNGEIFSVSSGKVARVGFVVSDGYFDPTHTAEDLRENADRIRSLDTYFEPGCTADEVDLIPGLFKKGNA